MSEDNRRSRSRSRSRGRAEEAPKPDDSDKPPNDDGKLFIGNLSFDVRDDDLRDAFGKFGPLAEVRVVTDRDSGRSKGFGFVTFENGADADASRDALHQTDLLGRDIRVDKATPRGEGISRDRPRPRDNTCYTWRDTGDCRHGDRCKFDHGRGGGGGYRGGGNDRYDDRRGGRDRDRYDDRRGGRDRDDRYDDRGRGRDDRRDDRGGRDRY